MRHSQQDACCSGSTLSRQEQWLLLNIESTGPVASAPRVLLWLNVESTGTVAPAPSVLLWLNVESTGPVAPALGTGYANHRPPDGCVLLVLISQRVGVWPVGAGLAYY